MTDMKDGGPAFPVEQKHDDGTLFYASKGMSLRDWFAGQALAGLIANTKTVGTEADLADDSYKYADAMLAARGSDE